MRGKYNGYAGLLLLLFLPAFIWGWLVWWLIESGPVVAWWVFGMFVAFLGMFVYYYILQEK